MVSKFVTHITETEVMRAYKVMLIDYKMTAMEAAKAIMELEQMKESVYRTHKFIDVQRLLIGERLSKIAPFLPLVPPRKAPRYTAPLLTQPYEEKHMHIRHLLSQRELQKQQYHRLERVTPLHQDAIARLVRLHPTSILLTDQQAIALLESYLWTTHPQSVVQIVEAIIDMCRKKQLYLPRIPPLEHLERLMLERYVPMYMARPDTMNMISFRLTQMTLPFLEDEQGTFYEQIHASATAIKSKAWICSALERRTETKKVASSKSKVELFPVKFAGGITTSLDKNDKLYVAKGLTGEAIAKISVLFALRIPYRIKVMIARSWGLPENYTLLRRPKIQFMPLRLTVAKKRSAPYWTPESISRVNRDDWLKAMQRFKDRH